MGVMIWFQVFLVIQLFQKSTAAEDNKINIKAVRCNYTEAFIYKNFSCFAKVYSRTVSTITIRFTPRYPMKFNVSEH